MKDPKFTQIGEITDELVKEIAERGTPKTLYQAIQNALEEIEVTSKVPDEIVIIERHVRDFLANKFSGPLMLASERAEEASKMIAALYTSVTGKEIK